MAAHRIIRATSSNHVLPRCKSEGTLIDLGEGVTGAGLNDVKVPSPSALRLDTSASYGDAQEVVAIKDYCPSSFTTLKFAKGDRLYVLDTSGGEWWYAHNHTEMGYIPAAYVQPVNFRNSSLSDSGVIDSLGEGYEDWSKEFGGMGEWTGTSLKPSPIYNNSPLPANPFTRQLDLNCEDLSLRNSNLIMFDALASPSSCSSFNPNTVLTNGFSSCHINSTTPTSPNQEVAPGIHRDNPFFRSKRSHSLSELSVLQAQSNPMLPSSGFFTGLKAPSPEQFQSREDFRTAWLNHRKLARSCHDLDSLGQSPGWGQTQPVETNIVCRLDSNGGVVQLPDTQISIHIPEGHVSQGDHQQISMKALLDPPLELNSDHCSSVSPVVEIKLSNMEIKSFITLEMKVLVSVKKDSRHTAKVLCVRSDCKEGPYAPIPNAYLYSDTVQVQLDSLEPCMYVAVVVQSEYISHNTTVWDHVQRKVTLGVYGPKHIHPSFKTVVAMFGHDCAPSTLLVNEVGRQASSSPPVALQLWGKHQFLLGFAQDLLVGLYSNMSNYHVRANEGAGVIRGFQIKLGKVSRLLYMITSQDPDGLSDFTLRVQVKDALGCILTQFCVQTPPPPTSGARMTGQRRFLKRKEVDKIVLSPLAVSSISPKFQDRCVTNLKFGKLIKTVIRQHKSTYLLEYKKGDVIALLSEEKIKLRGQLRTKEWYIGYYQGTVGLVHAKNVLVLGKVKPIYWVGPDLTTTILLEQILKPCKFLTYIYATVRTVLMENVGSWRAFADALGNENLPMSYFCRTELDNEAEKVASVLEKLKEDCTNVENKERKSFQRELMMALLKMDCQGLVARLVLDFVLLTTAVEVALRWRELAEKLARVSRQQMEAYEAPHRDRNGQLDHESMWKPAYDFLLTWAAHVGDSYRDVIQELHLGLDKMRNPITKKWKHLTGTLILVNCLDTLRGAAFCPTGYGDFAV
ncbi:SH3 domain-binding protein 4-A [Gasterosteus aculeatus]